MGVLFELRVLERRIRRLIMNRNMDGANGVGVGLLILMVIMLLVNMCGCSTITYTDPAKGIEVKVENFLMSPEMNGFEWVFDDGGYVRANGVSSKVSDPMVQMLMMFMKMWASGMLPVPVGAVK